MLTPAFVHQSKIFARNGSLLGPLSPEAAESLADIVEDVRMMTALLPVARAISTALTGILEHCLGDRTWAGKLADALRACADELRYRRGESLAALPLVPEGRVPMGGDEPHLVPSALGRVEGIRFRLAE